MMMMMMMMMMMKIEGHSLGHLVEIEQPFFQTGFVKVMNAYSLLGTGKNCTIVSAFCFKPS